MTTSGLSRAQARRLHALKANEETGNIHAWIDTVLDQYVDLRKNGAPAQAMADLRAALLQKAEELRATYRSRVGRLEAGDHLDYAFGILLRDVFEHGDRQVEEVFQMTETARARMLLDSMAGHWQQPEDGHEDRISALEQEAMAFDQDNKPDITWQEMSQGSARALGLDKQEISLIEEVYEDAKAGFLGVEKIPDLAEVQAALGADEVMIEFIIPHHPLHPAYMLWALVIDQNDAQLIPINKNPVAGSQGMIGSITIDNKAPIDSSPLGDAAGELRVAVQKNQTEDAEWSLRALHDFVMAPILQTVSLDRFKTLVIVPHRMMHAFPFAALRDEDGVTLQDQFSIVTAPSSATWLKTRTRPESQTSNTLLALANPAFDPVRRLTPLPDAEREIGEIDRLLSKRGWQTETLTKEHASEEAFAENAKAAKIIYLATHGERPDIDALDKHGALLAKGPTSDGVLTAQEIRRHDLTNASLVVLSVCDGGLFRFAPGDEPLGLVPALLAAGADNVIAALWPIDDAAGRALMTRTMRTILDQGPAAALTDASKAFSRSNQMPLRDWAAFICIGSGSKLT